MPLHCRARGSTKWPGALSGTTAIGGKIVGPMSFEEVAVRINRAPNEEHLVWTEGMARWADAKAMPAFTDLFRATPPPPLPALALSSLSSEDEIVWTKLGSRASPPVLRAPPVLRDEPSAIAQPLSDTSPSPAMLLTLWRREVRHSDQPSPFFSAPWRSLGRPAGSATVTPQPRER
jgi:hypothetical protein